MNTMPQSTLQKAAQFYQDRGDDFWHVFDYHQRYGHVYIDFECIALARPCRETDPFKFCFPADADAFYIEYVYGAQALRKMMRILAVANPRIKRFGFTRTPDSGDVHFYDIDSFRRKTDGII